MNVPDDLFYTESHEWLRMEAEMVTVGITDYAQSELGDIVFVDLPEAGSSCAAGDAFGSIEAVKTVSDLYAPLSGEIAEVNESLSDKPESINEDAYGAGWIIKIKCESAPDTSTFLSADDYKNQIAE